MKLFQLLLPLYGNDGSKIARARFTELARELAAEFGGVTAYLSSPAVGLWRTHRRLQKDTVVVYEVVSSGFDLRRWRARRKELERTFRQNKVLIRVLNCVLV